MANKIADEGKIFVCYACGKRSKDKYGDKAIDEEWDESCMMHAVEIDDRRFLKDRELAREIAEIAAEELIAKMDKEARGKDE